jgi:predicted GIY-YIG superfamily endonuclease
MSVIYIIDFEHDLYIGSCNDLHKRIIQHKTACLNEKDRHHNIKLYQFIRKNYKWEEINFEILEQHESILEKKELLKREQQFLDTLHPTLNSYRAFISAEDKKQIKKQKFNCECGGKYTGSHQSHHYKTNKHQQYIKNK